MSSKWRGVNKMLDRHGQTITLRKKTIGSYNPVTGTTTNTTADYSVKGYFYHFSFDTADGTNIQAGDSMVGIKQTLTNGNSTPKPDADDEIVDSSGNIYKVVNPQVIEDVGNTIVYLVKVRQ